MKLRNIVFVLALVALFSAFTGGALYYASLKKSAFLAGETQTIRDAENIRNAVSAFVVEKLQMVEAMAGLEAVKGPLKHPSALNLEKSNRILDLFQTASKASACYLMDRQGVSVASSNRNEPDSFVGKQYAFRPYFKKALRGDPTVYMALGVTSGQRGIYYSHPVYDDGHGSLIGVAVIKDSAEKIETEFKKLHPPANGITFITDVHGIIFMSNHEKWLFRAERDLSRETVTEIEKTRQFGKGPWPWIGLEWENERKGRIRGLSEFLIHRTTIPKCPGWNVVQLTNLEKIQKGLFDPLFKTAGQLTLALCILVAVAVYLLFREASRDIHRRKQIEEALRASEANYREIFNVADDALFIQDKDTGRILDVNERMCKLFGYSVEEARTLSMDDFSAGRGGFTEAEALRRIKEAALGEPQLFEWMTRDKHGRGFWVEVNLKRAVIGEKDRLLAAVRDISARKQSEEDLVESEGKFRTVTEQSPNMIFINQGRRVIYCNQRCEELMGYSVEHMCSEAFDFLELIAPQSRERVRSRLERHMEGEEIEPYECSLMDKNGNLLDVLITTKLIPFKGKHAILGIVTDLSKQKKLEVQFQQAQKMESLGTLAGGIAHDFNNLLMGIQGNASLMLLEKDPADPDHEKLSNIVAHVKSGAELTKQLLGFARRGKYQAKPTNVNELIGQSSEMFGRTKKEIIIHKKFHPDIWAVEADQGQIQQVLFNLYVNAWQAMPGGGDLYLETDNVFVESSLSTPFHVEPGRYVKISVTDTGVGMDQATRERIFDPFFTTKDIGRGTGLGLASVYGIVKNHNGFINVYSEKGKGAAFTIYLPASEKVPEEEELPADQLKRGKETVLLVDDEAMILKVGASLLQRLGYRVLPARSGREALDVYTQNQARIHLVILDMIMPEMNGGEVYDRLKAINPRVKVLLASGYSADGEAKNILDRGCDGFVQKPFQTEDLSEKLREILDA